MSIYVLRSETLMKIGFSEDLPNRVRSISAAIPLPVVFVGHMPGGREVEAHLHQTFSASRFSGEWFVETPEMTALFATILIPELPLIPTRKSTQRQADFEALKAISDGVRRAAESRWPLLSKAERVKKLSTDLGWNHGRAKDLYYQNKRMSLRASEQDELREWIAPELKEGEE